MHSALLRGALCLALTAFASAACDKTVTTIPDSGPTSPEVTEPPFTGTLTINGGVTQAFSATAVGNVTAVIANIDPNTSDFSLSVGLALGTWNGTSCQIVLVNDNAGVGAGVAGFANAAGELCARVYDVGKLTQPVTFDVTIKHY